MSSNLLLGDILISSGKKMIYIPEYIKANAKTRRIAKLRMEFEELIKHDKRFAGSRTSEIFITLGKKKGERELKYYPKVWDSYYSHVSVMS
jgi:hypothetical protein